MMGDMGMGFGVLGSIFMLVFWGLLILAAVWVAKALFGNVQQHQGKEPSQNPREILDQRYARGEITREQYEIMKQDIG
jgi:putative membrane protein